MSREYEFLRECGAFFVLTINENMPAGRPFGAVMERDGRLYISTGDMKSVYAQLKANTNVQIVALKPGTRNWIRISGIASECSDMNIRQAMLDTCPVLTKHFPDSAAPHFAVFEIEIIGTEIY